MTRLTALLLPGLLCLSGGAAAAPPPYADLIDFPRTEANFDRFYSLEGHLAQRFDTVCADTLCAGDYSGLRPLQLRCSVDVAAAQVRACTWIFIASELRVDGQGGLLQVDNRNWQCALPLGTGVPVETFFTRLEGADALHEVFEGAAASVGEAVHGCLTQPVAPLPPPAPGAYVDARDYPRPGQGHGRFRALEQALVRGFDNICGDTFCEGDYYNLQAMRLRCSVHARSGRLGQCVWTFAGSNAWVAPADGSITVDARDWACALPLAPATPLALLLDTLRGDDAIDQPLPGTRTSTYDSLTSCL